MLRRSFNGFLKEKPEKNELDPYLYSIAFKELGQPKKELKDEPIICNFCSAILIDQSIIKKTDASHSEYVCEYCGTKNILGEIYCFSFSFFNDCIFSK